MYNEAVFKLFMRAAPQATTTTETTATESSNPADPPPSVMSTNTKAAEAVQASLDACTSDPKSGISGLVFVSVDRRGDVIQANASGLAGAGGGAAGARMSLDTVFWVASCTKLLTAMACLQQVEAGTMALDDAKQLYGLLPELERAQVIADDGKSLRPRKNDVTLRMLLTHTAGFGYEFFNTRLRDYGRPAGFDSFSGDEAGILRMPLVNEPGTAWEYGVNIDWAGIALERATGQKLNDYFQKKIMEPLGLKNINMFPTPSMRANLASMHQRWHNGSVEERDHIFRRALAAVENGTEKDIFNSGGAGAFATPMDYVQVLAALLNDGTSPKTGAQILKPETVRLMWENQIPQFPDFARQGIVASKSDQTNAIPELYPQAGDPPQGWGISFHQTIAPGPTGRGANTAWWAGIANCFWWCDREKGVAGMIASQIMPFGDAAVMGQWGNCEKIVYDNL